MSNFTFQILYPVWVGIAGNLLLAFFNVSSIGAECGPFRKWYFKNGGNYLMCGMWAMLLFWSAINGYRAW